MKKRQKKNVDGIQQPHWSHTDTLQLINFYRTNELMWNSKCNDFYKKRKRDAKIAEFLALINNKFTDNEVRLKWRNLRNYFAGEVKKEKDGKVTGGQTSAYTCCWEFYEPMQFLIGAEMFSSNGNVGGGDNEDESSVRNIRESAEDEVQNGFQKDSPNALFGPRPVARLRYCAKRQKATSNDRLETINVVKISNNTDDVPKVHNTNEAFAKYVALSLDALPPYNQAWARREIENVLFNATYSLEHSANNAAPSATTISYHDHHTVADSI